MANGWSFSKAQPLAPRHPSHPRSAARRSDDVRPPGSSTDLPADHTVRPPRARRRADRADRRRGFRRLVGVRRAGATPGGRPARRGRPETQPLSHHGAVLADAPGAADRTQPPLGRDGRHHRDRHVRAGLQQYSAEGQGADRGDVSAQRIFDEPVRQVPRGSGVGGVAGRAVRAVADRFRFRALLRVHRGRGQPVLPGPVRGHQARRAGDVRRRRATPQRGSGRSRDHLGPPAGRWRPTSRSSCTTRPAPPTPRTTSRGNGRTSTRASSTTAGKCCASRCSRNRRILASCPPTPN